MNEVDSQANDILVDIARSLDIPEHICEEATLRYADVGEYLAEPTSPLALYTPSIYPQGSFRLGTTIKPLRNDEYDIDLVCLLNIEEEKVTQNELKHMVGARLKSRGDLTMYVEEMRRCWRINFGSEPNELGFHLDVLPSIPNVEAPPTGILLSDKELRRWQSSNPIAYADWFKSRMQPVYDLVKSDLAKALNEHVDVIPEWRVKTPLQQSIQILKRHRDLHFRKSLDHRPVSIVLTTLAARAYNGQTDLLSALTDIVRAMDEFVEYVNGKWSVKNPVDDGENFADKWNEDPQYQQKFVSWIAQLQSDLERILKSSSADRQLSEIERLFGPDATVHSAQRLGRQLTTTGAVSRVLQVPGIGTTEHVLEPNWQESHSASVKVSASVYRDQHVRSLFPLSDVPVSKGIWLRFTAKTNAPKPYTIKWQVVNTGAEAFQAHQPRGDFYDSDEASGTHRWETTAYRGTHWVEAFVIHRGICVARSGRKYVRVK